VEVVRLGPGGAQRWARFQFSIEVFLYVLRRARSFDVVHIYTAGWAGFLAPLASRLAAVPCVFSSTLQGSDDPASIRSQSWGGLKLGLLRLCKKVVAYTPGQAEAFVRHGFPSQRVLTLTCGIDDQYYTPGTDEKARRMVRKAAGQELDGPVILFIGTLSRRKGVDLLLDSFRLLLERIPNAVLVLMGPKSAGEDSTLDEAFVANLQEQCQAPPLKHHVAFLGRIDSRERKRAILRASDVFALFSHNEGLGIVVLEAMACGVPPVLTALPLVFDYIVDDGQNGRIATTRDPAELAGLLSQTLSSPHVHRIMSQKARERVRERFAMDHIAAQYFKLYSDLHRPTATP